MGVKGNKIGKNKFKDSFDALEYKVFNITTASDAE